MSSKILKICTSRSWGGLEMSMAITSQKLRERGHQVLPACYRDSPIHRWLTQEGFEPLILNLWGKLHPWQVIKLARFVNRQAPDVIHVDYSRDLFTVVPALKLARPTPLVLHKHVGTIRPKNLPVHPPLYSRVDFVIAISEVIRRNFIATHPIAPEKVGVIHHGVDLTRFHTDPAQRERVRAELGVAPAEVLIGIVGRLQFAKGHHELLQMAQRVAPDFPNARFIIVGEATRGKDAEADQLLAKIDELSLGDRLILTGYREDIPALLGAMDLFVFPSHAEAFGLVLIEAMAMKLPVVSANCDGILDIVEHGRTGLLVPPRDVTALVGAVTDLLQDPEKRRSFGDAGYQRAQAHFSDELMMERLESLYRRLAEQYAG